MARMTLVFGGFILFLVLALGVAAAPFSKNRNNAKLVVQQRGGSISSVQHEAPSVFKGFLNTIHEARRHLAAAAVALAVQSIRHAPMTHMCGVPCVSLAVHSTLTGVVAHCRCNPHRRYCVSALRV